MTIGGRPQMAAGELIDVVQPHNHAHVLGQLGNATNVDVAAAIDAAKQAAPAWRELAFDDRAAIFLKAADLLAGPWRATLERGDHARASPRPRTRPRSTPPASSIDFWRFNVALRQPHLRRAAACRRRAPGTGWSTGRSRASCSRSRRSTSPSIAGNLPTAPALMGNTVVWKPAATAAARRRYYIMRLLRGGRAARRRDQPGLPATGRQIGDVALPQPAPRGHPLHRLDRGLPAACGRPSARTSRAYRNYPRIVGETGGKDFIFAHPSADPGRARDGDRPRRLRVPGTEVLGRVARLRPAVALAGDARRRRCARSDRSAWATSTDFRNFMGAVIDERAFDKHHAAYSTRAEEQPRSPRSWPAAAATTSDGLLRPSRR